MARRSLWGEAVIATLPAEYIDASDLRQVPDTQEVFLAPDSDISVILEILQAVDLKQDEEAIRHIFDSLAHDNDAFSSKVTDVTALSTSQDGLSRASLRGWQSVSKFNKSSDQADLVRIYLGLIRIPANLTRSKTQGAEMLVCVNAPAGKALELLQQNATALQDESVPLAVFEQIMDSLHIVDYSLFA
ncbi:uncharacterized protein L969DRAFT_54663 [Mixia osmundae IAM 14324]|uniref:Ran guanine nucleotide release factor n=1 Tax=Mixia osmundae (strain CBS 9802 / IAM 14324 / JCM 22182 / KY 12970) TaxID=764103 RepID=G7E1G7_MIXOS|nr:uncharacterized protein L969DRAFT_54663 [Mixia osmundae IAM 14324]KEI36631.1 hypothetical protein L969DRAFT_54663 [Mixia osmundae IAM 14324]GAA96677.1 hypothetical protein E5Q_03348 [Mixia osmundae IAM 14324]